MERQSQRPSAAAGARGGGERSARHSLRARLPGDGGGGETAGRECHSLRGHLPGERGGRSQRSSASLPEKENVESEPVESELSLLSSTRAVGGVCPFGIEARDTDVLNLRPYVGS